MQRMKSNHLTIPFSYLTPFGTLRGHRINPQYRPSNMAKKKIRKPKQETAAQYYRRAIENTKPEVHDPEFDPINPTHYKTHPSGVECITITRHHNFNVGNAIKYAWRHLEKPNPVEELKKAIWYLQDEVERINKYGKS
jgi:Protein of unknwon function (DUF3310)